MNNKEWFQQAKFGMMVHWGLYSLPAGEWKEQRMPFIGEWAQSYFRIKNKEYNKLAGAFNPVLFDAEEWVKLAIESGMQYMVVTSKHHDGFAMFHSRVDQFNIYDATLCDIVQYSQTTMMRLLYSQYSMNIIMDEVMGISYKINQNSFIGAISYEGKSSYQALTSWTQNWSGYGEYIMQ
ncbi:MAG TPA: alpha-L-fucosidase [Anaerolineaceae bacterium]|jgi:hypothetical protein